MVFRTMLMVVLWAAVLCGCRTGSPSAAMPAVDTSYGWPVITEPTVEDVLNTQRLQEEQADLLKIPVHTSIDLGGGIAIELVLIPAGDFYMGLNGRTHQVTLSRPFYMGTTEITQAQWFAVMETQPWNDKESAAAHPDHAASHISWNDATRFCTRLSQRSGRRPAALPAGWVRVDLPTEAQWEYAARAGTTTPYYFGSDADRLSEYAWYRGNTVDIGNNYAHPVGQKKPNAWGLYDMHGNAWEWCQDWYLRTYSYSPVVDPKGPRHLTSTGNGSFLGIIPIPRMPWSDWGNTKFRVRRGGGFDSDEEKGQLQADYRARAYASKEYAERLGHNSGFRICVEIDRQFLIDRLVERFLE